jgi:hypothetical protein
VDDLAAALRSATHATGIRSAAADICASLLDAWSSHLAGSPDADDKVRRLDRSLAEASPPGSPWLEANLVVARILEDQGDIDGAYAAARRQVWHGGVETYMSTYLREQGRLAARLGDAEAATRAYRSYLAFHDDPDPGPARDAAESARRDLSALRGRR